MHSNHSENKQSRPIDRVEFAIAFDRCLREKVLPYWYDQTLDKVNGGYKLADSHRTLRMRLGGVKVRLRLLLRKQFPSIGIKAKEKHIVSQTRLVWTFSLAHRLGYNDSKRNYLQAAEFGYRFLIDHMLDKRFGGAFWKVDSQGNVLDSRKPLYGQAFAIYALVEYYRVSGSEESLAHAVSLFRTIQAKMHDDKNSGWIEYVNADFSPLEPTELNPDLGIIHVVGLKSGGSHLHWMEALSELFAATGDASVRDALEEVLKINTKYFFPREPANCSLYFSPDWRPETKLNDGAIPCGHNIEFAWLMLRAQQVLQVPLTWDHFDALLMHALKFGFDHQRGGFYQYENYRNSSAFKTEKVWWVQAEGLAALGDALQHQSNKYYETSLSLLLDWIWNHQMLSDGIWVASTDAEGKLMNCTKAGSWKAAYHEVRALTKFIQAFSAIRESPAYPKHNPL